MKRKFFRRNLCALCILCGLNLIAAPLQWACDWPEAKAQTFSLYQGETATFEPTFLVQGRTVTNATIEAVWYQTNGMGNAWWKLDGATFAPSNDVGAASYRFFVEARSTDGGRNYRANGALRMLPSPGFTPNEMPAPVHCIDFAAVEVLNPPWPTPGDIASVATASTNYTDVVARMPKAFTVAGGPTYPYSGDSTFPMGYYYRVNTGDGKLGYAAKIPAPVGNIVVTGGADDPMIARFGSSFHVDSTSTTLTGVSGYVEDGCYSVADFTYGLWGNSGITVYLHSNILAGSAELSNVTGSYNFDFETPDGKTHYVYFWNGWEAVSGGYSTTYSHEWYDPNEEYWDWEELSLTVGYETTASTDYEYSMFGGTELVTVDALDTARSQLQERKGRYGELGTGWGYKLYDFTKDLRYWELKVPRLNVTVNDSWTSDLVLRRQGVRASAGELPDDAMPASRLYQGNQWIVNLEPLGKSLPPNFNDYKDFYKGVVFTTDKYSTDGCRSVDYRLGFLPKNPEAEHLDSASDFCITVLATNIAIATSGQPYLWGGIKFETALTNELNLSWTTNSAMCQSHPGVPWDYIVDSTTDGESFTNSYPIKVTYSLSNFRPSSVTYNNYVATLYIDYDLYVTSECIYLSTSGHKVLPGRYKTYNKGGSFSVTLRTVSALDAITEPSTHIITPYNQHMIWDEGLKCTWELCVTNGVFFVRKVSDLDYREKEFIE